MNVLVKNKMNQSKGFALSILLHGIVIAAIISTASNIRPVQKIMVVDFNILESPVKKENFKQTVKEKLPFYPEVKPLPKKITPILPKPPVKKKIPKKILPIKHIKKIAAIKPKLIPLIKSKPKPKLIPIIKSEPEPKLVPKLEVERKAGLEQELTFEPKISIKSKQESEILNFSAPNQIKMPLVTQNISANPASELLTSNLTPGLTAPAKLRPAKLRPGSEDYQAVVSKYTKAQFSHIQKSIQQHIKYPRIARKMGWEGKVVVEFIICKDGTVKNILTVKSSGFKALDKNAVESIKKAAPFPIPPTTTKLIIPVVYRLNTD